MQRRSQSQRRDGFSFVELLVVIAIIGLAATAVILAVPDPGGSVQSEAERFAARAKAARDSAIVEARPIALTLDPEGYAVSRRTGGEWRTTARYDWSDGTAVEAVPARTRFDSTGLAEPLSLTLRRGERAIAVDVAADGNIHVRR